MYCLFNFTSHRNSPPNLIFFTINQAEINQSQILRKSDSMHGFFQNEGLSFLLLKQSTKNVIIFFQLFRKRVE